MNAKRISFAAMGTGGVGGTFGARLARIALLRGRGCRLDPSGARREKKARGDVCLDDDHAGQEHHETAADAHSGSTQSALPGPLNHRLPSRVKIATLKPETGAHPGNAGLAHSSGELEGLRWIRGRRKHVLGGFRLSGTSWRTYSEMQ